MAGRAAARRAAVSHRPWIDVKRSAGIGDVHRPAARADGYVEETKIRRIEGETKRNQRRRSHRLGSQISGHAPARDALRPTALRAVEGALRSRTQAPLDSSGVCVLDLSAPSKRRPEAAGGRRSGQHTARAQLAVGFPAVCFGSSSDLRFFGSSPLAVGACSSTAKAARLITARSARR